MEAEARDVPQLQERCEGNGLAGCIWPAGLVFDTCWVKDQENLVPSIASALEGRQGLVG